MLLQAAYKSLQDTAEAVGLRLKAIDKKTEKAQTQSLREDLESQLADQTDPAAALSVVVPLLVIQVVPAANICSKNVYHVISNCVHAQTWQEGFALKPVQIYS